MCLIPPKGLHTPLETEPPKKDQLNYNKLRINKNNKQNFPSDKTNFTFKVEKVEKENGSLFYCSPFGRCVLF